MKKLLLTSVPLLFMHLLFAQVKPAKGAPAALPRKPVSGDCASAIPINVNTGMWYGLTDAPSGHGAQQEMTRHSPYLFEEEHNTAWYLLNITRTGMLSFTIVPEDTSNDYDFVLFPYTDSSFCSDFVTSRQKPLRSNLSNTKPSDKGVTGLGIDGRDSLVGKGPNVPYSIPLSVKKGERYMLVLDNVTPNGKGHRIFFNYIKAVTIKGKVTDAANAPIAADITLSDNAGNTVTETKSDAKGEYSIHTQIAEEKTYSLTYLSDSSFVQTALVNTTTLKGGATTFPDIKTVLPALKKGAKYTLGNINFYGDSYLLLPGSQPSVKALGMLMKKNKKMVIKIEGHVNDPARSLTITQELYDQVLSDQRALAVYTILLDAGIDEARMSTEGLSNKHMLYPHPEGFAQAEANRRVEIKVMSVR